MGLGLGMGMSMRTEFRLEKSLLQLLICAICGFDCENHDPFCLYAQLERLQGLQRFIGCPKCEATQVEVNKGDFYECRLCNTQYRTGYFLKSDLAGITEYVYLDDPKYDDMIKVGVMPQKGEGVFPLDERIKDLQEQIRNSPVVGKGSRNYIRGRVAKPAFVMHRDFVETLWHKSAGHRQVIDRAIVHQTLCTFLLMKVRSMDMVRSFCGIFESKLDTKALSTLNKRMRSMPDSDSRWELADQQIVLIQQTFQALDEEYAKMTQDGRKFTPYIVEVLEAFRSISSERSEMTPAEFKEQQIMIKNLQVDDLIVQDSLEAKLGRPVRVKSWVISKIDHYKALVPGGFDDAMLPQRDCFVRVQYLD